jgi:hypothetical protein
MYILSPASDSQSLADSVNRQTAFDMYILSPIKEAKYLTDGINRQKASTST